jgi:hypothetical protein
LVKKLGASNFGFVFVPVEVPALFLIDVLSFFEGSFVFGFVVVEVSFSSGLTVSWVFVGSWVSWVLVGS